MTELTEKQMKTRWTDIKRQIKERQLLAYRVGIPLDKWDEYMHSIPSNDEINRIYFAIQDDRKNKTTRIKEELSKIVGYREAKQFSKKSGVSDASIKDIIEGKKEMAGYDIINKLELFLHVTIPNFELSIENPLSVKSYTYEHIAELASDISKVSDSLKYYCFKLTENARKMEKEKDWRGNDIEPTYGIDRCIEKLSDLKSEIELFWHIYIDKKS
ncbi:hypothetical protein [Elizabethkingia anophelis]|uniref:hypothetical protein n=1 Tax=Elizabethkingia anophelis TaxID=1117645 RepID=UPI00099A7F73|nr:hypothetical protein [Elizabethkingia anophelis]AQX90693.1 hypothetical protein AYC67_17485 [Elizabethkingia anophelis]EHM7981852.1 hypothetical protein [Elizabethkingia anophelis]EHZ9535304.1 hypothetical protein [Elizabethkingia anophelis]EKU3673214.1 hypothetical protein [Elizabethkingia anophelis]EKU4210191.1 hypothetical protein [Elizabethkingia anophelis]